VEDGRRGHVWKVVPLSSTRDRRGKPIEKKPEMADNRSNGPHLTRAGPK
jgi:hypothetical protein